MNIETIILTLQIVQGLFVLLAIVALYTLAVLVYSLNKYKVMLTILAITIPAYLLFGAIGVSLICLIYALRLIIIYNRLHIEKLEKLLEDIKK